MNACATKKESKNLAGKFKISSESLNWTSISDGQQSTFIGYENLKSDSKIVKYSNIDNGKIYIVLDKTPFYAESGGQVSDKGKITGKNIDLNVLNVRKENQLNVHICEGTFKFSDPNVFCQVDKTRRQNANVIIRQRTQCIKR